MRLLTLVGLASILIMLQVGCGGAGREPRTAGNVSLQVPRVDVGEPAAAGNMLRQGPAPIFVEPTPLPEQAKARLGHLGERVTVLAFSANGATVAAENSTFNTSRRPAIHLWDTATGKHRQALVAHKVGVLSAAFSPDGKQLATGGVDNRLFFWDAQTGKLKDPNGLKFAGHVYALEFTSDSKNLLVGNDDVHLVDAQQRTFIKSVPQPDGRHCSGLRLAPDGHRMASIGAFGIAYWKMPELEPVSMLPQRKDIYGVRALAFTSDGKNLLHFAYQEKSLWRWDEKALSAIVKTGKPGAMTKQPLPSPKNVAHPFAFTPHARRCVHVHADSTDDGDPQHVLILSETADLKEIRRIKSPCTIASTLISPDGKTLAAGGEDGSLRLWNLETGKLQRLLLEAAQPIVSIHPAGKNLISLTDDGVLHTWNLATQQEQEQKKLILPPFHPLKQLSHDGKTMLTVESDGSLHVWDMQQGKKLWSVAKALAITPPQPPFWRPRSRGEVKEKEKELTPEQQRWKEIQDKKTPPDVRIDFAPDDRWVVGRTNHKQITLWDTATGQVRHRIATAAPIQAWALAPDGKTIIVAFGESPPIDDKVRALPSESALLLDVASGKTLRTVPLPALQPKPQFPEGDLVVRYPDLLALAPDGNTLAVVEKIVHYDRFSHPNVSRQIRVWNLVKLEQIDLLSEPTSSVMAFSPDSKRLAFGCLDDTFYGREAVGVWERSTRTVTKVPGEQRPYILTGLSFQSDAKTLAAFSTRELNHPPLSSAILLWDTDALVAKKKPAGK